MRCFNNYKDDRICDMCSMVNNEKFTECKNKYNKEIDLHKRLRNIQNNCPYKTSCWDERNEFNGCNKNGNGNGRFADECKVSIECESFIKLNQ